MAPWKDHGYTEDAASVDNGSVLLPFAVDRVQGSHRERRTVPQG